MHGIVPTVRSATRAAPVRLALLVILACSGLACSNPTSPSGTGGSGGGPPAGGPVDWWAGWNDLGERIVTMIASPSCSLPDYAMKQSYTGHLRERGQELIVTFADPGFIAWAGSSGFAGTRDGSTVRFTLNGDYFVDGYSFVYLLALQGAEIGYTGTAAGTMDGEGILATFDGTVLLYHYADHQVFDRCNAPDHRIEVVRK
jgi:hypothetical protein